MLSKLLFIFVFLFIIAQSLFAAEIIKDVAFDKENLEISYVLTKPASLRISLGIEEGPIFATLLDWQFRKPGIQKEKWNKTGIREIDNLLCSKKAFFTFNYFTHGLDQPVLDLNSLLQEEVLIGPIGRSSISTDLNLFHKGHKRKFCHEPKTRVILSEEASKTKGGIPVINRPVFLTIELDPKDKKWFQEERYSLYIFIDTVFVHGQLDGFSPYHWRFDPKGLNKGIHLVTVNLRGFNDHIGIANFPVCVE